MPKKIKVSCIQYNSTNNLEKTLSKVLNFIDLAMNEQPDFIALPECSTFICQSKDETLRISQPEINNISIQEISKKAKKHNVNILIGSLQTKINKSTSLVNRSYLINNKGCIIDKYDKIHMFDAKIDNKKEFRESFTYNPGELAIVSKIIVRKLKIKVGMTICYDLRFPELYKNLAKFGSQIFTVPSAFTYMTGKSHWHTLLKSRAIENGCFVIAPAQVGKHYPGRTSYGHSLIISPWGDILAEGDECENVISAIINIDDVNIARTKIPNLKNSQNYNFKIN